jgi:hypothetical protein
MCGIIAKKTKGVLFFKTGFHYVAQAGLELLNSGDLPNSASLVAGTTEGYNSTRIQRRITFPHIQILPIHMYIYI